MTRRRPGWFTVALVALLVMPLAEIAVILQVGRAIGGWPTFWLLLVESAFGAWLVKREGAGAWRALRTALRTGRMPAAELVDAALVLVGGVLLLTPGFITDALGFFFVLPPTRPITRRWLQAVVERQLVGQVSRAAGGPPPRRPTAPAALPPGRRRRGRDHRRRPVRPRHHRHDECH